MHPAAAIPVTQRTFLPGWLPPLEEGGSSGGSHGAAEGSRTWGVAELLSVGAGEAVAGDTMPRLLWEVAVPVQGRLLVGFSPLVWLLLFST